MRIEITAEDIATSETIEADPITISLQRQFGKHVSVSRNFIRVRKRDAKQEEWIFVPLPGIAKRFLVGLGQYDALPPFQFDLAAKHIKTIKANA